MTRKLMLYCKLAEKFGKWGTCNRLSICWLFLFFTQMMFLATALLGFWLNAFVGLDGSI